MKILHTSVLASHFAGRMIQVNYFGNDQVVLVAPGRYWIGDPIAVFPEVEEWTVPIQIIEGHQVLAFETHGLEAGKFTDCNFVDYNCKSGLLGLVPAALLDCRRMQAMEDHEGGCMIRFDQVVVCLSNEAGMIQFGPTVTIDTRNPA